MLGSAKIVAFVPTRDSEKARRFYVDVLGLSFVSDDQFALVLSANGTTIRVSKVPEYTPYPFTSLGWDVEDIGKTVSELAASGVSFEKYGFPGQDERGIWTAPAVDNATGGAKVAWFKDPDGNLLSLTQICIAGSWRRLLEQRIEHELEGSGGKPGGGKPGGSKPGGGKPGSGLHGSDPRSRGSARHGA